MSFISYAQNFEDVMLWRALRHVGKGFYIDAAAGGPDAGSLTRALYERGWHGVNLEPSRDAHAALLVARPADVNLQLVAGAAAAGVTVYDVAGAGATLDEARARQLSAAGEVVVQRQLEQQTLSALCSAHAAPEIHFLKVGTGAALAGLDLARWRPWILVVAHGAGEARIAGARYELAYNDGLNNFYVAAEHPELRAALCAPPSAADEFVLRPDHPYAYPLAEWRERVAVLKADVAAEQARATEARSWAEARVLERDLQADAREHAATELAAAAETREQVTELRAQAAEAALAETAARADRAEHALRDSTSHYEATIQGIYHSWSWRITRPLRSINFRAKALRSRLRTGVARLRGACAQAIKGSVRRVVRAIMSRPALSYFVRSQIGRHPRLTNWLRVTVQRTQAGTPAPAAAMELSTDPDNMPSSARQVLDDLRRTMKSTRSQ